MSDCRDIGCNRKTVPSGIMRCGHKRVEFWRHTVSARSTDILQCGILACNRYCEVFSVAARSTNKSSRQTNDNLVQDVLYTRSMVSIYTTIVILDFKYVSRTFQTVSGRGS